MAGGRAGDHHLGAKWGNTSVVLAVFNHLPLAVFFFDFNDRTAVGGHFDLDQIFSHTGELCVFVLAAKAGEHDFFAGVLVVNAQQAVIGAVGAKR